MRDAQNDNGSLRSSVILAIGGKAKIDEEKGRGRGVERGQKQDFQE
jgi:hypothetical protein